MPSTALYRPLDAANNGGGGAARPMSNSVLRGTHSGKVRSLWPKTANSRRVFVCVIILTMLLVYVVWCAVVNYTDDARGSYGYSTGKLHHENETSYNYYYPTTTSTLAVTSEGGQKSSEKTHHGYIMAVAAPLMLEKLKLMGIKTEHNTITVTASGSTALNNHIQSNKRSSSHLILSNSVVGPNGGSVSARAMQSSSNMLDNKITGDSPSTLCAETFNDTRVYIQERTKQDWGNLSIIYFVTPTYPRREQVPELTRLAYTLLHVPRLHWIVANDHNACNPYLDILLNRFGIPYTHLASPMPDRFRKAESKPRGVANRRAALNWLRQHNITNGILYFGDDDNTYDLKLFSEIRDTKHVSMFPVGLIANYGISGPVVRKGKVIGFLDSWVAGRRWPVDMAGFAVSLSYMAEHPNASMPFKPGYEEDYFLRSIGLTLDMIEPKGNNCTEILVWHTQTKNHERTMVKINHEYLDDRSNLGALFKSLAEMGVSNAADDEGQKAIISKNGKAKPLGYFLS